MKIRIKTIAGYCFTPIIKNFKVTVGGDAIRELWYSYGRDTNCGAVFRVFKNGTAIREPAIAPLGVYPKETKSVC